MSDRDARLQQFFACYFNQDWDIGGAKVWTDVVAQYVNETPSAQVTQLQADLRSWLEETASPPAAALPASFGCDYDPRADGLAEREWVRLIAHWLESYRATVLPMLLFSEDDRRSLAALKCDAACEPAFELLKSCLVWPDERPDRITNAGYGILCDMWIVRGYIHRLIPVEGWKLDPQYFKRTWECALREVPSWPGFRRLVLSASDRATLERALGDPEGSGGS